MLILLSKSTLNANLTSTNRFFTNDDWQRGRFENFESDHQYESNLESDVRFEIESNHEASQVPTFWLTITHSVSKVHTKMKFHDISRTFQAGFWKLQFSASSIYHFSGLLQLPHTDPLPSPFNAHISSFRHTQYVQPLYLSVRQFFVQLLRLLTVTIAKRYLTAEKIPCQMAKSPENSSQNSPDIPWFSRKW